MPHYIEKLTQYIVPRHNEAKDVPTDADTMSGFKAPGLAMPFRTMHTNYLTLVFCEKSFTTTKTCFVNLNFIDKYESFENLCDAHDGTITTSYIATSVRPKYEY